MAYGRFETLVGLAVIAIAAGFLYNLVRDRQFDSGSEGYDVVAHFTSAHGISTGSDVEIAGVKVGSVSEISLDPETLEARVVMRVGSGIPVPADSFAKISQAGLLGPLFVDIEPGGGPNLTEGERIFQTQGYVGLVDALAGFFAR